MNQQSEERTETGVWFAAADGFGQKPVILTRRNGRVCTVAAFDNEVERDAAIAKHNAGLKAVRS